MLRTRRGEHRSSAVGAEQICTVINADRPYGDKGRPMAAPTGGRQTTALSFRKWK